ncbi:hypothetical protein LCGC14_2018090 [marine sediment metagenome]|uniref:Uncharacterized protein n=1 Tax=marine sediment metagenome TaxID=412755 RepID=A0A0F9HVG9_9ZZZZ
MKAYIVRVPEVHVSRMVVNAKNENEAKEIVMGGGGSELDCQYDYTLGADKWSVKEAEDGQK